MVWTTPRTWGAFEVPSSTNMNAHIRDNLNFLKSGISTFVSNTSTTGPTSGTTELLLASSGAITFDGTTNVEVAFGWFGMTLSVGTDVFNVTLFDGATVGSGTQIAGQRVISTASAPGGFLRAIVTPSAGAHTYTARIVRTSGTGTATVTAASPVPMTISVSQVN